MSVDGINNAKLLSQVLQSHPHLLYPSSFFFSFSFLKMVTYPGILRECVFLVSHFDKERMIHLGQAMTKFWNSSLISETLKGLFFYFKWKEIIVLLGTAKKPGLFARTVHLSLKTSPSHLTETCSGLNTKSPPYKSISFLWVMLYFVLSSNAIIIFCTISCSCLGVCGESR